MTENDLTKDQVTETAAEGGSTEAPEAPPAESAPAPAETPAETPAQPAPPAPAQDQTPAPVEDEEDIDQEELARLYEQSLRTIQEGEVARGTIVAVENDYVVVDIGYKSEGQIDINEFKDADGNIVAEVGQEVDVLLERAEDEEGTIILSREKAAKIKVWDEISRVYNDDGVITGTIVGRVKGGMSVDIGVQAFCPAPRWTCARCATWTPSSARPSSSRFSSSTRSAPTSCSRAGPFWRSSARPRRRKPSRYWKRAGSWTAW